VPFTHPTRVRNGQAKAARELEDRSKDVIREALPELSARLLTIANGRGGRGAASQVKAICYAFDRVIGAPTQTVNVSASLEDLVNASLDVTPDVTPDAPEPAQLALEPLSPSPSVTEGVLHPEEHASDPAPPMALPVPRMVQARPPIVRRAGASFPAQNRPGTPRPGADARVLASTPGGADSSSPLPPVQSPAPPRPINPPSPPVARRSASPPSPPAAPDATEPLGVPRAGVVGGAVLPRCGCFEGERCEECDG